MATPGPPASPTRSSNAWRPRPRRGRRRRLPSLRPEDAAGTRRGFVIRADGASRGNPGPASIGVALIDLDRPDARDPGAAPDASISEALGRATNNVAEWTAVVRGLELARGLGAREVELLLDSRLIVEQLAGRWRVKDPKLGPLHAQAHRALGAFERWTAGHVPRAFNATADALANEALDRVASGGPTSIVLRPGESSGRWLAAASPRPSEGEGRAPASSPPIAAWLDGYLRAWASNDPGEIGRLFADDAVYRPTPFADGARGREAIVADWLERRDEPGTWSFASEILCSASSLAVVRCRIGYPREDKEYQTIWLVRLDPTGQATEFTEWWMERPKVEAPAGG